MRLTLSLSILFISYASYSDELTAIEDSGARPGTYLAETLDGNQVIVKIHSPDQEENSDSESRSSAADLDEIRLNSSVRYIEVNNTIMIQ